MVFTSRTIGVHFGISKFFNFLKKEYSFPYWIDCLAFGCNVCWWPNTLKHLIPVVPTLSHYESVADDCVINSTASLTQGSSMLNKIQTRIIGNILIWIWILGHGMIIMWFPFSERIYFYSQKTVNPLIQPSYFIVNNKITLVGVLTAIRPEGMTTKVKGCNHSQWCNSVVFNWVLNQLQFLTGECFNSEEHSVRILRERGTLFWVSCSSTQ